MSFLDFYDNAFGVLAAWFRKYILKKAPQQQKESALNKDLLATQDLTPFQKQLLNIAINPSKQASNPYNHGLRAISPNKKYKAISYLHDYKSRNITFLSEDKIIYSYTLSNLINGGHGVPCVSNNAWVIISGYDYEIGLDTKRYYLYIFNEIGEVRHYLSFDNGYRFFIDSIRNDYHPCFIDENYAVFQILHYQKAKYEELHLLVVIELSTMQEIYNELHTYIVYHINRGKDGKLYIITSEGNKVITIKYHL